MLSADLCYHYRAGRDRLTRNDAIGTTHLNLAKIASSGGEIEGTPVPVLHMRALVPLSGIM